VNAFVFCFIISLGPKKFGRSDGQFERYGYCALFFEKSERVQK
jgi:hypothetical protein